MTSRLNLTMVLIAVAAGQAFASPKFLTLPFANEVAIMQGWFYNGGGTHQGIDFATGDNLPILAAADGEATRHYQSGSYAYGNYVIIDHGNGFKTLYAHLSSVAGGIPSSGSVHVDRGNEIGRSGSTGTDNPHLHFEALSDTDNGRGGYNRGYGWRWDPYDLYQQRSYYPGGSNWSGCGGEHLWTQCPPVVYSPCTPANNIDWRSPPAGDRWYRSNERLTYHVDGTDPVSVRERAGPHDASYQTHDGYIDLSYGGAGFYGEYRVDASNACGNSWKNWNGGYDTGSPTASRSGGASPGVWNTGQSVSWSASDGHSGVRRQWYRWNGGGWAESGGPAGLPEGKNTLEVQVEDNAWNGGSQDGNVAVVNLGQYWLDTTPPLTTAQISPPSPNGQNGWYVTNPSVTLSATDPNGANGSGVARTDYSIDGGGAVRYTGAFVVAGGGSYAVQFWSTDVAGNVETQKSITVAVDTAPPVVTSIDD